MPEEQGMQLLQQKFLTSINVADLEKSVLNDKLAKATYQQIVDSVAKAEQKRSAGTKWGTNGSFTNCRPKRATPERTTSPNENLGDTTETGKGTAQGTHTRKTVYCKEIGHLQYNCPQKLEDRENGIERPSQRYQRNAKKICTNCGRNNHTVQECRRPRDYRPGTAYDNIPYQTINRKTGLEEGHHGPESYNPNYPNSHKIFRETEKGCAPRTNEGTARGQ